MCYLCTVFCLNHRNFVFPLQCLKRDNSSDSLKNIGNKTFRCRFCPSLRIKYKTTILCLGPEGGGGCLRTVSSIKCTSFLHIATSCIVTKLGRRVAKIRRYAFTLQRQNVINGLFVKGKKNIRWETRPCQTNKCRACDSYGTVIDITNTAVRPSGR
jgi:hypothetical protein